MLITPSEKLIDLDPYCDRKSFYKKCYVIEYTGKNVYKLYSYNTFVAWYDDKGLHRKWSGYSATTLRHVDAFRRFLGMTGPGIGKAEWLRMEVE